MAETAQTGNGGWMQAAMSGLIAGGQAITKGGPKRQYKYNKKMASYQNKLNRQNAEWVLAQNQKLLQEQRIYDSPESQMLRYRDAGLNPHLIYDKVAGTNTPISMGNIPGVQMGSVDASYPDIAGDFMHAQLAQTQMGLTEAKTIESEARQELMGLQRAIAATNPMLNPSVYERTIDVLMSTGELKLKEQSYLMQSRSNIEGGGDERFKQKIDQEIEAMAQKLGLNTKDLEIKNKILQSKEYENALKEIQLKWMKDADITPQHIYQGLMLLLTKMM